MWLQGRVAASVISDGDLKSLFKLVDSDGSGDMSIEELTDFVWGSVGDSAAGGGGAAGSGTGSGTAAAASPRRSRSPARGVKKKKKEKKKTEPEPEPEEV